MKTKYTLMAAVMTVICLSAQAQIRKGTHLLGGSIGFYSEKVKPEMSPNSTDKKRSSVSISPAWGIAVRDNFVLGAELSYGQNSNNNNDEKYKSYGVGVFARKYWEVLPRFYLFGQARAGYYIMSFDIEPPRYGLKKQQNVNVTVVPGITYAASKKIYLEATFLPLFSFDYQKFESDDYVNSTKNNAESMGINTSLSSAGNFSLGIRILLGNK